MVPRSPPRPPSAANRLAASGHEIKNPDFVYRPHAAHATECSVILRQKAETLLRVSASAALGQRQRPSARTGSSALPQQPITHHSKSIFSSLPKAEVHRPLKRPRYARLVGKIECVEPQKHRESVRPEAPPDYRIGTREPDLGPFFHRQIGLVGQPVHLILVKVSLVSHSIRWLHIGDLKSDITKTSEGAAAPRHY